MGKIGLPSNHSSKSSSSTLKGNPSFKNRILCYYCKKGHIVMNCTQHPRDLLDGKLNADKALATNDDEDSLHGMATEHPAHIDGEEE